MQSLEEIIDQNAEKYGGKTALCWKSRNTSFKALRDRVNRLCNALTDIGLKKGDRVAILSQNRPEYFETYCAAKGGYIIVPLNTRFIGKELTYMLNNADAQALIFEEGFTKMVEEIRGDLPGIHQYISLGQQAGYPSYENIITNASPEPRPADLQGDDLWAILYTSGTTGLPKGAMLTHSGKIKDAFIQHGNLLLNTEDIALHVMPFFHVGGMWYTLFPCFSKGITNVILSQFEPAEFLRTVEKYQVTRTFVVPTMVIALLEELGAGKYDVSTLNCFQYAASPMPAEPLKKAIKTFPNCRFLQQYGSSEMAGSTLTDEDHRRALRDRPDLLHSCGQPWPETEFRIVGEDGSDAAPGEVGEIAVKNDRIMLGYWNNPDGTARAIRNGWLFSGDIGKVDKDGYFYLLDRKKDMIVTGGENVFPTEVEGVLYQHPAVLEAAVIGVPHEKWVEAVRAIVVLREGKETTEEKIIAFCKSHMAGYKCPKSVDFVTELPKTPSGKVLRRVLREKYSES